MKFTKLLITFLVILAFVNTQAIKTLNLKDQIQPQPFIDQRLTSFLNTFQMKLKAHPIIKEDVNSLKYLLKVIYILQKSISGDERQEQVFVQNFRHNNFKL